jgi:hypothetical protein
MIAAACIVRFAFEAGADWLNSRFGTSLGEEPNDID